MTEPVAARAAMALICMECESYYMVPASQTHIRCLRCFRCGSKQLRVTDPPPSPCRIASTVAREIEARAVVGLGKYGVTVADSPLSRAEWLQHAYEEACDLAVYLRRLIEMEKTP